MDFPATERTQQFYGHGDPAREAVAGKYSSSSFYEESHSSTRGAEVGEGLVVVGSNPATIKIHNRPRWLIPNDCNYQSGSNQRAILR